MGQVYSHLSEEERQVIQIEVGNETDNRPMRALGHRTPAEAFADEPPESAENKDAALTNR